MAWKITFIYQSWLSWSALKKVAHMSRNIKSTAWGPTSRPGVEWWLVIFVVIITKFAICIKEGSPGPSRCRCRKKPYNISQVFLKPLKIAWVVEKIEDPFEDNICVVADWNIFSQSVTWQIASHSCSSISRKQSLQLHPTKLSTFSWKRRAQHKNCMWDQTRGLRPPNQNRGVLWTVQA